VKRSDIGSGLGEQPAETKYAAHRSEAQGDDALWRLRAKEPCGYYVMRREKRSGKTIRFARNFNIPSEKFAKFTARSVNTLAQFSEWLDCPGVRL